MAVGCGCDPYLVFPPFFFSFCYNISSLSLRFRSFQQKQEDLQGKEGREEEDVRQHQLLSYFISFYLLIMIFLIYCKCRSLREEGLVRHQGALSLQREEHWKNPSLKDTGYQGW